MFRILIYFFFTLPLSRAEFSEEHANEDQKSTFTFLIPSSTELLFYKRGIPTGGVEVVYDCTAGNSMKGTVLAFDKAHPTNMRFLTIKNCDYVKVEFPCRLPTHNSEYESTHFLFFNTPSLEKSIKIENISNLELRGPSFCSSNCVRSNFRIRLHIRNVRDDIKISFDNNNDYYNKYKSYTIYDCFEHQIETLILENLKLSTLDKEAIPLKITQLYLKEVEIENINQEFTVGYDENSAVRITDSYFGSIQNGSFVFDVEKVQIQRNHFKILEDNAFSGVARNSFMISDNHFENIVASFEVKTPNIQFINNTVKTSSLYFLRSFELYSKTVPATFNFSQNFLRSLPEFVLKTPVLPGLVLIKNNRFNCSCESYGRSKKIESVYERIFNLILNKKENNNVCANYGNCHVSKYLRRIIDTCLDKFECPENDVQIEDDEMFVINSVAMNVGSDDAAAAYMKTFRI